MNSFLKVLFGCEYDVCQNCLNILPKYYPIYAETNFTLLKIQGLRRLRVVAVGCIVWIKGYSRIKLPYTLSRDKLHRAVASDPAGKSLSMVSLVDSPSEEPGGDPPSLGGTGEDYITDSSLIIH